MPLSPHRQLFEGILTQERKGTHYVNARHWYFNTSPSEALFLLLFAACAPPAPAEPAAPSEGGAVRRPACLITWGDNPAQLQSLFDRYGEANDAE